MSKLLYADVFSSVLETSCENVPQLKYADTNLYAKLDLWQ